MTNNLDSSTIRNITEKEKEITGESRPVAGGPTAQAQKHAGEKLDSLNISDITQGERKITGDNTQVAGGPAAMTQSMLSGNSNAASTGTASQEHTGKFDSATISAINAAESRVTGQSAPVQGGPTAKAQSHANETINSQNLHDITEGEKSVTSGDRVKGGPTATAQSELGKSRNQS